MSTTNSGKPQNRVPRTSAGMTDQDYVKRAQEMYASGVIEIDDNAPVDNPSSPGENFGRWVQAWVWTPTVNSVASAEPVDPEYDRIHAEDINGPE